MKTLLEKQIQLTSIFTNKRRGISDIQTELIK